MSEIIKPIETEYNGYKFRSKLEAQWAVFFDALNIKYEYEPEGFEMSDGTRYLPDFYLPEEKYYIEVKGYDKNLDEDIKKIITFCFEKPAAVIILSKIPYDEESKGLYLFPVVYYQTLVKNSIRGCHIFFNCYDSDQYECQGYIEDDFAIGYRTPFYPYAIHRTLAHIQATLGKDVDEPIGKMSVRDGWKEELSYVQKALKIARQTKFDHSQTPTPESIREVMQ